MEFYSRGIKPPRTSTPTGEKEVPVFEMRLQKGGGKELVEVGKTNRYEEIQLYAEQCEIENIMRRYQNGDYTALEKIQGMYGDFTQTPRTLAEAQQLSINLENMWGKLPLDIREQFHHNLEEFINNLDKLGTVKAPEKESGIPYSEIVETDGTENAKV